MIHQVDRISYKPVVTAIIHSNKGLNATITYILQLLIIGTVHVCFNGTKTGCSPTNLHKLLQFRIVGIENGILLKRIAGESSENIINNQGIISCVNSDFNIPVSSPV